MSRPRVKRTNIAECWGNDKSKLTGWRVGRLTVVKIAERRNEKIYWLCKCDCGTEVVVFQLDLKRRKVISCGKPMCLYKAMKSEREFWARWESI